MAGGEGSGLAAGVWGGRAYERLADTLARLGSGILDLLYPPHCMACRAAVCGQRGLCPSCWASMPLIERPYCERLGTPFAQNLGPGLLSPQAIAHPPVFGRARAVAAFEGAARNLVHLTKYNDRPELADVLGRWMARAGCELVPEADVLVPVPLHAGRLWRRRFNQAALLANAIGRLQGKRVALRALERVKPTRSQVGMSRAERAANIQGAFRLSESGQQLRGLRVLLVDDVLTTGATANAASRVLLRGGVASVDLLVFAQVVTSA